MEGAGVRGVPATVTLSTLHYYSKRPEDRGGRWRGDMYDFLVRFQGQEEA